MTILKRCHDSYHNSENMTSNHMVFNVLESDLGYEKMLSGHNGVGVIMKLILFFYKITE